MSHCREKTGVDSLVTLAPKAIIERIKLAASGVKATFACGGTVKCPKPVRILFSNNGASIETQVTSECRFADPCPPSFHRHIKKMAGTFTRNRGILGSLLEPSDCGYVQPKVLELPKNGDNAFALEDLVAACSAATFGKMNPDNPKGSLHSYFPIFPFKCGFPKFCN